MPFLTRVQVTNYRSIASCDVRPGPLTVLAGPNAAGKSNFLDAIRFLRDALNSSPAQALESRGGLQEVLHRDASGRPADHFRICLHAHLPQTKRPALDALYLLEVGTHPEGDPRPVLRREKLLINGKPLINGMQHEVQFPHESAQAQEPPAAWRDDTLHLPKHARENTEAWALYARLRAMRFYELLTPVLRAVDDTPGSMTGKNTKTGRPLGEQGEHLPRVLATLAERYPWIKETIDGYLATMIDNAAGLDGFNVPEADLAYVTGRFVSEGGHVAKVDRRSLSEGTLRLAGVLTALFQPHVLLGEFPLIGIEEPEISLHPPMLGALYDALVAAARNTQVMVTPQSADLLDNAAADPAHLLVVQDDGRGTQIGPIDAAGRQLLDDGVLTLPELLRSGEMRPATTPGTPGGAAQAEER
ncbi:hypothetical protein BEN35_18925 [Streptomyces fradiae]|nr:hypothetical protein BEN35_18925 [Streptomyces fradiae]